MMVAQQTPGAQAKWSLWRRSIRVLSTAMAAVLLAGTMGVVASAPARAATEGCDYAASGPGGYLSTICWVDWSGFDPVLAASPAGQQMSVNLDGGLTASFTVKTEGRALEALPVPLYEEAYFGRLDYQGLTANNPGGRHGLDQVVGAAGDSTVSISQVRLENGSGAAVSNYRLVAVDAEDTGSTDAITFRADTALNQIEPLGDSCGGGFSGEGTTEMTCQGNAGGQKTGAAMVAAIGATELSVELQPGVPTARQGMAFGVMIARVMVNAEFAPQRYDDGDQLRAQLVYTDGTVVGEGTTTGTRLSTTTNALPVVGQVRLREFADSGSLSNYTQTWSCANNGTVFPASGTSGTLDVKGGDNVICTISNAPRPKLPALALTGHQGASVSFSPTLPADVDPASLVIVNGSSRLKTYPITGQGTWSVGPGALISFSPEAGYQGSPAPLQYSAEQAGVALAPSTLTLTYPDVTDVDAVAAEGQPVTLTPNLTGLDPATLTLVASDGAPTPRIDVPAEGSWVVAGSTVTFTPAAGFTADPTPVRYRAADAAGYRALPAKLSVTFAGVQAVSGTGAGGEASTVAPSLDAGLSAATVSLLDSADTRVTTLPVAGEGVWTVAAGSGAITFTPEAGVTADPAPVRYTAAAADGGFATAATVTVRYPEVAALSGSGISGHPVTLSPLLDDDALATTVTFVDSAGARSTSLDAPNEGAWTIDPASGAVTFTPVAGFTASPAPVLYAAADAAGNFAVPASITLTYVGLAAPAQQLAAQGEAARYTPVLDAGLDAATLTLIDERTGAYAASVTVPQMGVWSVNADGTVGFVPAAGFHGNPPIIRFTAANAAGLFATPVELQVRYPDVGDAYGFGVSSGTVTITPVLRNGVAAGTVVLRDAAGAESRELVIAGQGTWRVLSDDSVMFTPEPGFDAAPDAVEYTAKDAAGNAALPATLFALYPLIGPATGSGLPGKPVTVYPEYGPSIDVTTATLLDPASDADVTTYQAEGEGAWAVDSTTGAITFTPASGFAGNPTPMRFTARDGFGSAAAAQTVTLNYPRLAPLTMLRSQGVPAADVPVVADGIDPSTVVLTDPLTGAAVTSLVVAGEGTWKVNETSGEISFFPAPGFQGEPTPLAFTAADANGVFARPAAVSVSYPNVFKASGTMLAAQSVTLPLELEREIDRATLALVDADGNRAPQLVVPGEGTWTLDPASASVTFTPQAGFFGAPSAALYVAADTAGHWAQPASITLTLVPEQGANAAASLTQSAAGAELALTGGSLPVVAAVVALVVTLLGVLLLVLRRRKSSE